MDDYFRIFEMTARAQSLPEGDWVGNLVPKLTEKAKSIYLEILTLAAKVISKVRPLSLKLTS